MRSPRLVLLLVSALFPSSAPLRFLPAVPARLQTLASLRAPAPLACSPAPVERDGEPSGAASWIQANLLQGVAIDPSTVSVMIVYFVQGALGLASLARTYFLKDQLGLAPAEQAALMGITTLPWVIKPVYGFLTDGLPIAGLRRKPYLIIAGLLGSAAWASLATVVETPAQAVLASTVASLGVALSDVVVDSLVVERAREDETASSGALQSLCWTCQSAGGLVSAYFSGSLLATMSPRQVFSITAALPLLVAAIALQLDEKRVVNDPAAPDAEGGPLASFVQLSRRQGALLWETVRQKQVWLPALFIFLWQATPSCGDAFFYFITGARAHACSVPSNPRPDSSSDI